ncbi:MAG TPA: hypothetical protein VK724_08185 [Bryobacteraceae bacterium]|jgi:hypothetical protein|nr:hypothetical protein [Bryobacteraceae bacterium]
MRIGIIAIVASITSAFGQAPPAQPAPSPAPSYARAAQLPARIEKFTASPESIKPGQSVTITWAVENPTGVNIDPTIGKVRPRGTKTLSPSATTTYTLTVHGPKDQVLTQSVTVTVPGTVAVNIAPPSGTPAGASQATPRMPDGKPNLTGVYNSSSFNFGGTAVRGQNDPIQAELKPGAEKYKVVRGPTDAGVYSTCMPTGVPLAYFVPYQWEIVQGLDKVVILYEYLHMFRVVSINGTHPADPDPTWMGDSIGHWEGDTLVVDSVGYNDRTELPGAYRHSEALHVVERFHRTDLDHLEWQATVEDPNVFAKPWVINRVFPLRTDLDKVDEYVCENNKDYKDLFGK